MQDVVVIFAFLGMFISGSSGRNSTEFLRKVELNKQTCRNPDSVFRTKNVSTSLTCSSICASDVDCKSFFYFPTSLRCDGCKQTHSTDGGLREVEDKTVYYIMPAHPTTATISTTTTTTTAGTDLVFRIGYKYIGCFIMPCHVGQGGCVQRSKGTLGDEVSEEFCMSRCQYWLHAVKTFALKDKDCMCDLNYENADPGTCDTPCAGNPGQMCGGQVSATVFSIDDVIYM